MLEVISLRHVIRWDYILFLTTAWLDPTESGAKIVTMTCNACLHVPSLPTANPTLSPSFCLFIHSLGFMCLSILEHTLPASIVSRLWTMFYLLLYSERLFWKTVQGLLSDYPWLLNYILQIFQHFLLLLHSILQIFFKFSFIASLHSSNFIGQHLPMILCSCFILLKTKHHKVTICTLSCIYCVFFSSLPATLWHKH